MKHIVKEAILVEGTYDIAKLNNVVDTIIVQSRGFRIFKDKQMINLLKNLADSRGLIILTDSDGAGFVIRNYISGIIPPSQVKHAYIPACKGKEKRKTKPSKEGLLGVEGMGANVIVNVLKRAGATFISNDSPCSSLQCEGITPNDLYLAGLSGSKNSKLKRNMLLDFLGYPKNLTAKRLVAIINASMSKNDFFQLISQLDLNK